MAYESDKEKSEKRKNWIVTILVIAVVAIVVLNIINYFVS